MSDKTIDFARLTDNERTALAQSLFRRQQGLRQNVQNLLDLVKESKDREAFADAEIRDADREAKRLRAQADKIVADAANKKAELLQTISDAPKRVEQLRLQIDALQTEKDQVIKAGSETMQRLLQLAEKLELMKSGEKKRRKKRK